MRSNPLSHSWTEFCLFLKVTTLECVPVSWCFTVSALIFGSHTFEFRVRDLVIRYFQGTRHKGVKDTLTVREFLKRLEGLFPSKGWTGTMKISRTTVACRDGHTQINLHQQVCKVPPAMSTKVRWDPPRRSSSVGGTTTRHVLYGSPWDLGVLSSSLLGINSGREYEGRVRTTYILFHDTQFSQGTVTKFIIGPKEELNEFA